MQKRKKFADFDRKRNKNNDFDRKINTFYSVDTPGDSG